MGTTTPLSLQAARKSRTILSRSLGVASMGTRSLSWRFTPHAPISPSTATISLGGNVGRTASPKGSRPRLPSVHRPKENLCSGLGSYVPFFLLIASFLDFGFFYYLFSVGVIAGREEPILPARLSAFSCSSRTFFNSFSAWAALPCAWYKRPSW